MRSRTFVMRQVRASVWMVTKLPSRGDGVAWGRWGGGIKYMLEGWDSGTHVRTSVHIGYTHHSAYRPDQGEVQDELKDATGSQSLAGSAAQWTRTFFIRPSVFSLKKKKRKFCFVLPSPFSPPYTFLMEPKDSAVGQVDRSAYLHRCCVVTIGQSTASINYKVSFVRFGHTAKWLWKLEKKRTGVANRNKHSVFFSPCFSHSCRGRAARFGDDIFIVGGETRAWC